MKKTTPKHTPCCGGQVCVGKISSRLYCGEGGVVCLLCEKRCLLTKHCEEKKQDHRVNKVNEVKEAEELMRWLC